MTKDFPGIPPAKIYNPATRTYQVVYLETNQEANQTPSSPVARNKIIRKWGGNYVSERAGKVNPGYGPGDDDGLGTKTKTKVKTKTKTEHSCNPNVGEEKYDISLSLTGEYSFKQGGATFKSCKISGKIASKDNIKEWLKKLENRDITIVKGSSNDRDSECIKHENSFKSSLESMIGKMDEAKPGSNFGGSITRP